MSLEREFEEVETHTNSVYAMVKEGTTVEDYNTEPIAIGECKPISERVASVHRLNKALSRSRYNIILQALW